MFGERLKFSEGLVILISLVSWRQSKRPSRYKLKLSQINIVTELVDSPSLQAALARTENSRMTEIEAKPLFKQLIEAVSYLHSRNICHRDIKIDNILLTAEQVVKLIDFGFSIESDGKLDSFCGTPSYIAP